MPHISHLNAIAIIIPNLTAGVSKIFCYNSIFQWLPDGIFRGRVIEKIFMDSVNFKKLVELSELDSLITDLSRALADFPKLYEGLEKAREGFSLEAEKAAEARKKLRAAIKDAENSLAEAEEGIRKRREELNSLKSREAMDAMVSEIDSLSQKASSLENEILSALEEEALAKKREEDLLSALKEKINRADAQAQEARQKEAELAALLESRRKAREEFLADIDSAVLERYEAVARKKSPAVVKGEKKSGKIFCSGCGMALTAMQADELQRGAIFVSCQNCSRMVYIKF